MNGMATNWANGPISSAVTGDAAVSTVWANPKTRPCCSNGTTCWSTVCSAASIAGMSDIHTSIPTNSSGMLDCRVKTVQTVQFTRLQIRMTRIGREPRPFLDTYNPPPIMPKLTTPKSTPHASTDINDSP